MDFHGVPERVGDFIGRKEELTHTDADRRVIVLHGQHGYGKTELALEYAYSKQDCNAYAKVFWVSADTEDVLYESLSTMAERLGFSTTAEEHSTKLRRQELLKWLDRNSEEGAKCLIILDNVPHLSMIMEILPVPTRSKFIITCKSDGMLGIADELVQSINVGPLTPAAAIAFFKPVADDVCLAQRISVAVGCHPLALNILRCLLECSTKPLREWFEDFAEDFATLEHEQLSSDAKRVGVACRLAHKTLRDEQSKLMLYILAFQPSICHHGLFEDPESTSMLKDGPDVPEGLPHVGSKLDNPFRSPGIFKSAKKALIDRGLIQSDDNKRWTKCHDLIRHAVQDLMTDDQKRSTLFTLPYLLNGIFPFQSDGEPLLSQWNVCKKYAPNVAFAFDACVKHLSKGHQPAILLDLTCRHSWYYYEMWSLRTAMQHIDGAIELQKDIRDAESHPGYSRWYVVDMESHLRTVKGAIFWRMGDHDLAQSLFQEALKNREGNARPGNEEDTKWIWAARANLAYSLLELNKPEEASPILEKLIPRKDMEPNKDLYRANLVVCRLQSGEYKDALKECERLIEPRRGKDDVVMAQLLFYLFNIHKNLDNRGKAEDALNKCLEIREQRIPMQPETAFTYFWKGTQEKIPIRARTHLENAWTIIRPSECHTGTKCLILHKLIEVLGELHKDSTRYSQLLEQYLKEGGVNWGMGKSRKDLEKYIPVSCRLSGF